MNRSTVRRAPPAKTPSWLRNLICTAAVLSSLAAPAYAQPSYTTADLQAAVETARLRAAWRMAFEATTMAPVSGLTPGDSLPALYARIINLPITGQPRIFSDGSVDVDLLLDASAFRTLCEEVFARFRRFDPKGEMLLGQIAAALQAAERKGYPTLYTIGTARLGERPVQPELTSTQRLPIERAAEQQAETFVFHRVLQLEYLGADRTPGQITSISSRLTRDQIDEIERRIRDLTPINTRQQHDLIRATIELPAPMLQEMLAALLGESVASRYQIQNPIREEGFAIIPAVERAWPLLADRRPSWAASPLSIKIPVAPGSRGDSFPEVFQMQKAFADQILQFPLPERTTVGLLVAHRPQIARDIALAIGGARPFQTLRDASGNVTHIEYVLNCEPIWRLADQYGPPLRLP